MLGFCQCGSPLQAVEGGHYRGLFHCAADSLARDGWSIFMRGGLAMALRSLVMYMV